jgi:hypothetical protein
MHKVRETELRRTRLRGKRRIAQEMPVLRNLAEAPQGVTPPDVEVRKIARPTASPPVPQAAAAGGPDYSRSRIVA